MHRARHRAANAAVAVLALVGCATDPDASTTPSPVASASASAAPESSRLASGAPPSPSPDDVVAAADALQAGTYAAVVTSDLILRSAPGTAPESEIFPDTLNAPMTVYVADGPVAADGYDWYLVEGILDGQPVGPWSGWVAAAGKDGEVWLESVGHSGGTWTMNSSDGPAGVDSRSAAMTPDGTVMVVGASWSAAGDGDGDAWTYDAATDAWEEATPLPMPVRSARSTATDDGLVFVIAPPEPGLEGLHSHYAYDTETDRWDRLDGPPSGGFPVTGADGRIYLIGRERVQAYDRATREWNTTGIEFDPVFWPSSAVSTSDGTIIVVGDGGPIARVDPVQGTFEVVTEPRMARFGAASAIGPDGRLYLVGGSVQGMGVTCGPRQMADRSLFALRLVEAYDFATDEWTTVAPLPMSLSDPSAFATDDAVVVIGTDGDGRLQAAQLDIPGFVAGGPLADAEQEVSESGGCGM